MTSHTVSSYVCALAGIKIPEVSGQAYAVSAGCWEKQRLTNELLEASRDIAGIHSHEMAELVTGSLGFPRSDLAFKRARQKHCKAKRDLTLHIQMHGC